jgi:Flp pilus assembly protein TadG
MNNTQCLPYRHKRGQSMMEFALVIPFLFIMIVGVIEAGWMMFFFSSVSMSAREAARYGAVLGVTQAGGTTLHFQDCVGIRAAARRVGAFARLTGDDQIEVYFDSGPGTNRTRYCQPNNAISSVNGGQRIMVEVLGYYQPLINLINIPNFGFKATSSYTIMSDIQISR